jgi:hypothetical protein
MRPLTIVIPLYALLGGAISALLFAALHKQMIYGVTAPFLPYMGIAASGLIYGRAGLNAALMVAIPALFFTIDFYDAAIITLTQIIPLNLFIRALMMALIKSNSQNDNRELIWSPPCWGVSLISIYGAIFYSMIMLMDNPLYPLMQERINEIVKLVYDDVQYKINMNYNYLLLSIEYISHIISIIIVTFITHRIINYFRLNRRPILSFANYCPPLDANLLLLAFCFISSGLTDGTIANAFKCSIVILILPYLYSGLSAIHLRIRLTKNPKLLIIILYGLIILLQGNALMFIIGYGIGMHGYLITRKISKKIG